MFEVYAVIASALLPVGAISFIYFIYHVKNYRSNAILWTLIFESIATILLGVFYMYSAIILSKSVLGNEVDFMDNNIDDLAIINDTTRDDVKIPTFYHLNEYPPDHNNEIEDTRNNKNKVNPSDFLQTYQNLIEASIKKKLQNATKGERSFYQRMFEYARNMNDDDTEDTLENQNCFLKMFFYQALLVYSFVTSAFSLLNICQICQQCSKEDLGTPTMKSLKSEHPSETFGDKISDDVSDKSSQNAAPVGPLFEEDSIGNSTPNLEVFSVKNTSQVHLAAQQAEACPKSLPQLYKENPMLTAGKCVTILVVPILLVSTLYLLMKNNITVNNAGSDNTPFNFLPNFNNTESNIQTANFVKNINANTTNSDELNNIITHVYTVINKFQKDHENVKVPAAVGHYLFKSKIDIPPNSTEECTANEPSLKTFDFAIFVVAFFAVIFYTKLTEVKLPKSSSSSNINKCIMAFIVLWTPGILDMIISRFLTSSQPNIFSTLLLLVGNMDRLYSTKQNFSIYKDYVKRNASINPAKQ